MNRTHLIASVALVALVFSSTPAIAQTPKPPKPPTDAKTVVMKPASGKLVFTGDNYPFVNADTQARDFDLTFTTINPSLPEFFLAVDFRASFSRFYTLVIASSGETGVLISREFGKPMETLKESVFSAAWKKNTGEKNDVGFYVRGGQAWLFINKQFVDQYDVGEINDFGELHLLALAEQGQTGEIEYQKMTVKVPANALPPTANGPTNNNIVVSLYRSGYTRWGRPVGMDDPRQGCQSFDDGRPVLQFQAVMKVTNNSKIPMKRWAPLALKGDGKLAFGCVLGYGNWPEVAPGASVDMTVEYYIEPNEAVAGIFVFDLDQGRSNRLTTPAP